MTDNEVKALAAAKLAAHGIEVADNAPFRILANTIGQLTGIIVPWNISLTDYMRVWAVPPQARDVRPFVEYVPANHRHWRAADIDRDQPPMMTPNGIGNFKQPGGFMPQVWGAGR